MAQYYLIPKPLAQRFPRLGEIAQRAEAAVFAALFAAVHRLSPERATQLCARLFGFFGPLSEKAEKARINLAIAFPQRDAQWREQTVREIFRALGESAAELIKMEQLWQQRAQRLQFVIGPQAAEYIEAKQPIVFVCAHVGAWQLTNLIAREAGLHISTVYAPESNPQMHALIQQLRAAFGVQLIPTEAGVRPLLRELRAGHCIGLATDTRLSTGQLLPFFGREALTNTTAARLALKSGAALLPIHARRLGGARYRIEVLDPLLPGGPTADEDTRALDLSLQINRQFERWISATPGQWICLKRRWPKEGKL